MLTIAGGILLALLAVPLIPILLFIILYITFFILSLTPVILMYLYPNNPLVISLFVLYVFMIIVVTGSSKEKKSEQAPSNDERVA